MMKAIGRNSKKITAAGSTGIPFNGAPDILSLPVAAWLNSFGAGIMVTNEKYICTWVNDALARNLGGNSPLDLAWPALIRFFEPMVADYVAVEKKMKSLRRGKKPFFGWEVPFQNGQVWEVNYQPVFVNGLFHGSVWQIVDISRRHFRQLKSLRVAEDARRAQKDLLASISHEIRSPLNAIIGMAHLLEETKLDPQQAEYVNILKHSSGILLGIVSDILDISRIDAEEIQVNQREFNLRDLIQSLRHTFELKLGGRPVNINIELDPALNTWLVGDDGLLNQILINLLGIAEKFTKEGEIAISATQESWQDNKLWVRFKVADTGMGIKKDKLELIFRNYKLAEEDIREKHGGTGLGLAIVKKLVECQGGIITVEEMTGFNTCFSFNIPFLDSRRPLSAQTGKLSRKLLQRSFENARVLVIEDNPMNLRYIMSLLEKYKINFQLATNGPDAVWFLEGRQYDLILMDVRIPGMNGMDLVKKMRADERLPNVATPVIATTAVAMETTASMARAAGITDILIKPYTPDQLLQIFNKYLNEDETELIMEEVQNLSGYEFNNDLDVKYLTGLYESNISYAADLFEIFIRTIRDELKKLQGMMDNHDWESMKFQVHKLKPNFSMVGLTWISTKMQKLENYLREDQELFHGDIATLFNEVRDDVNKYYPLVEIEYNKMKDFIAANDY
jgi:signal transduction histidine kinase/ActR/RegA family two-component response regulator